MPPLRNGRASKACDGCRRQKTRCYASDNLNGTCLRCETLDQACSLKDTSGPSSPYLNRQRHTPVIRTVDVDRPVSVDERYVHSETFRYLSLRDQQILILPSLEKRLAWNAEGVLSQCVPQSPVSRIALPRRLMGCPLDFYISTNNACADLNDWKIPWAI